jgi:hypothetical protein
MFIMARRTHDATASVETLVRRCVVFARKKFLYEPLCMKTKFAGSNHSAAYEFSTLNQFIQMTRIAVFGVNVRSANTLPFDIIETYRGLICC